MVNHQSDLGFFQFFSHFRLFARFIVGNIPSPRPGPTAAAAVDQGSGGAPSPSAGGAGPHGGGGGPLGEGASDPSAGSYLVERQQTQQIL